MSTCVPYPPTRSSEPPTTIGATGVRKSIDIGKHRVPLEHLDVEAEVRPEVAPRDDGKGDALERVDDERDDDHCDRATARPHSGLQSRDHGCAHRLRHGSGFDGVR